MERFDISLVEAKERNSVRSQSSEFWFSQYCCEITLSGVYSPFEKSRYISCM